MQDVAAGNGERSGVLVSASIAYDYIMSFPGSFGDHILADKTHVLSVSFLVDSLKRRRGGVAGNNLMQFLEERLDNVVYRLGFGGTRAQARQLVSHGLIAVDGKKLSIPSARVRVGQEISFTDRGKKSNFYKIVKEDIAGRDVPGWLEVNRDQLTGRMLGEPGPGDWEPHFNPNAVIEYYSR